MCLGLRHAIHTGGGGGGDPLSLMSAWRNSVLGANIQRGSDPLSLMCCTIVHTALL